MTFNHIVIHHEFLFKINITLAIDQSLLGNILRHRICLKELKIFLCLPKRFIAARTNQRYFIEDACEHFILSALQSHHFQFINLRQVMFYV